MSIESMFVEKCNTPSDINQLLGYIYGYALKCGHCTEMGVRDPTSTYALLHARPNKLVSYDIGRYPSVDTVELLAKEEGLNFEFKLEDVLKADIEETDLCLIDTFHTKTQLERELVRHAGKVRKYILFHDTESFQWVGENSYESVADKGTNCGQGIWYAIQEFLDNNPEWVIDFRTDINNGLTAIRRL